MEKKRLIIILIFIIIFIILIGLSILYYDSKKTVTFETGTEEIILTKYVNKNDKIERPIEPSKEGFVFKEWQLNGKKYDFESKVVDNIVLTAKWIKEEYVTITFITNTEETFEPIKVLKGNTVEELPIPTKDSYEFIGWYLNNKLYNNEEIHSNITLCAEYKNDNINTTYKKGDMVSIIGSYSNSAYASKASNMVAIGWDRKILNIVMESEFPYMVGNENGVTGFFKAKSLKEIK